jgi:gluconokinase
MGVASCGKTTVGKTLAGGLGARFVEGDKLHSAENVAKMSSGIPLTDADRWPWLAKIGQSMRGEGGVVAACSALKKVYRRAIEEAAGRPVLFVFLSGPRNVLQRRIADRKGHFMPPALLDSQLATLEPPGADESAVSIDLTLPPEIIVERAMTFLTSQKR